jgi:hypothetical protein
MYVSCMSDYDYVHCGNWRCLVVTTRLSLLLGDDNDYGPALSVFVFVQ